MLAIPELSSDSLMASVGEDDPEKVVILSKSNYTILVYELVTLRSLAFMASMYMKNGMTPLECSTWLELYQRIETAESMPQEQTQ